MIAIDKGDDQLTLRFTAGKWIMAFGIILPAVFFAGLALLVLLPRTATLSCSRASGHCAITESSHVMSKQKGEFPVADLRGAHVDKSSDGTRLVLETTTGTRDLGLGRRFNNKDVTERQDAGAAAIQKFVADPAAPSLDVSVPRRHGENGIWGGIVVALLFGIGCLFYRRRGTLTLTRSEVTWLSRGWLGTRTGRWPTSEVRGARAIMPSYYEAAVALDLTGDRHVLVIRQYRSAPGQRFVDNGAEAIREFLKR